jgi:hypothetical protein
MNVLTTCPLPAVTAASALWNHTSQALKTAGDGRFANGTTQAYLTMPFDAMRFQYAGAVMAGLVQRSIVASGQLERTLDTLEKLILGPLARQR